MSTSTCSLFADYMAYQPLGSSQDEFRFLTIVPLAPGLPDSAPVECHLQTFCLNDEHLTAEYKTYLNIEDGPRIWEAPQDYTD